MLKITKNSVYYKNILFFIIWDGQLWSDSNKYICDIPENADEKFYISKIRQILTDYEYELQQKLIIINKEILELDNLKNTI